MKACKLHRKRSWWLGSESISLIWWNLFLSFILCHQHTRYQNFKISKKPCGIVLFQRMVAYLHQFWCILFMFYSSSNHPSRHLPSAWKISTVQISLNSVIMKKWKWNCISFSNNESGETNSHSHIVKPCNPINCSQTWLSQVHGDLLGTQKWK